MEFAKKKRYFIDEIYSIFDYSCPKNLTFEIKKALFFVNKKKTNFWMILNHVPLLFLWASIQIFKQSVQCKQKENLYTKKKRIDLICLAFRVFCALVHQLSSNWLLFWLVYFYIARGNSNNSIFFFRYYIFILSCLHLFYQNWFLEKWVESVLTWNLFLVYMCESGRINMGRNTKFLLLSPTNVGIKLQNENCIWFLSIIFSLNNRDW